MVRLLQLGITGIAMIKEGAVRLENGSRVAIVGGGPAGCFFALYLLRFSAERGIHPQITIYEPRDFDKLGPHGCKGCAGILSMALLKNLGELGLSIPDSVIQSRIEQYTVHSPYTSITFSNPEKGTPILSIYRGGGPRLSEYKDHASFDGWLLGEAEKRGALIEHRPVSRISLGEQASIEVGGKDLAYDLIVLATGVNSRPIPIDSLKYAPPRTQLMTQDELFAGTAQVKSRLGNGAHVFLIPHSGMVFGTLVPKGPFINISVLSSGKRPVSVAQFLESSLVKSVLPEKYERVCGCQPKAVVSPAHSYYADRFVAIGDAAVSRLYKDGIGSSLLTARQAAHTAVYHGLSYRDFERQYQSLCLNIARDNRWGQLLFSLNSKAKDSRSFLLAQHRLIGDEQNNMRGPQPFTRGAWGMFTGSYSYRNIARMTLSPASIAKFYMAVSMESPQTLTRKAAASKRLHVGSGKVLILGSGFGGTYALRYLVRSLNRNENIETTMVSNENFFLFSPLLHEVAMGAIETRHIAYPIRWLHWRDRFNFVQADVDKIDLSGHKVVTSSGTLDFDYLVMALGSISDTSRLNAAEGGIFTLKTLRDSMLIRNHIIKLFEQASLEKDVERQKQLLTFVVTGAGHVGIQLVAELRDFIWRHLARFYKTIPPDNIRIMLVEATPRIGSELHDRLSTYALRCLYNMGIEIRLNSQVTTVWKDSVELDNKEVIATNTIIWTAGVIPSPRIAELDVAKDGIGRVVVNEHMEVPGVPGVYAVGDCAYFKDPKTGQAVPPRAHNAVRQAKVAAHNILAEIRGRNKKLYHYTNTAEIISLGASKATLRFHGFRLYGFPARLVWVLAYSTLVTGSYNRLRILTDWLLSLTYGRDLTHIKLDTRE
ncbi:MAG: FAD-dependent oxidoreductase [Chloroflexi bacterium]|nr:FAD-dependent oxidoreductase [Chloroflexota bacterium]